MIFVKSILTKKRFVITFGAFLILAILLPTVYKYLATFQSGSSEPQNKSCYSVKFKIVSKGENFIDATESILVENINSGSIFASFFSMSGFGTLKVRNFCSPSLFCWKYSGYFERSLLTT